MPRPAVRSFQAHMCYYLCAVFLTLAVFSIVARTAAAREAPSTNLDNNANAFACSYVFYRMLQDFTEQYSPRAAIQLAEPEPSLPNEDESMVWSEQALKTSSSSDLFDWPRIELNLGKGSLTELIDGKQFCGAIIYASRYSASLFVPETVPGLRTVMVFLFLVPAAYQHNEDFNYEKASLPTILTIFSIKSSTKLLDIDLKASGLSHYSSALFYAPVVIGLWYGHSTMKSGSRSYLWLAVPKVYLSSMLTHLYKGTAAQMPVCESKACRYLASGAFFMAAGLCLSRLKHLDYLPELDGLSTSFTGKVGKLAGYGLADALTEIAQVGSTDPFIDSGSNVVVLLCLTHLVDSAHTSGIHSYVTGSLRRGLIVRAALAAIELKLLQWSTAFKFIYYLLSSPVQDTDSVRYNLLPLDDLSAYVQNRVQSDQCSSIPVAGTATELYRTVCPAIVLKESKEASFSSLLAAVVVCLLTRQY